MARRALTTTATVLTTTAALLLTACGGGDDKQDDIKGADTGSTSPSASASASQASGIKRPDIKLPGEFQLTFDGWTSGDAVEQAVLDDAKEQLRAGYAAIIADEPDGGDALAFYDTASGLSQDRQWIKTYTSKNLTVFGKLPAYDPEFTLLGDKKTRAVVSYCTDESKAYTRNRATKEVQGNPAGTDPKVFYTVTLAKNADGVWQNVSTRGKRGGC
ncbi:hypothetical protein [Streptomyces brasiliensis]|uniref:Lipoprotein n=1 Tax=Streptomyces brasiliensis TaxID=1954 RepID=A0A917L8G1_9ACTN|nr:hypothetical protein [Streptomyces brasiliensis]GGJ52360.1 hypothetical protein GCM10010121_073970 [Streptomyces brasiliensis]